MHHLRRITRHAGFGPALIAGCMLPVLVAVLFSAQTPSKRLLRVTVTDPMGRYVTGLGQETFEVVENGVSRPVTDFMATAPIAIAIVGDAPVNTEGASSPGDEVIQTLSVADALRQLSLTKNARKALVLTAPTEMAGMAIPTGTQVVHASSEGAFRTVVELRNQYVLQFEASSESDSVQVVLHQPRGLPPLSSSVK